MEEYRRLLETPGQFKDGFGWTTIAGIFFCGLIMMPGAIYLGLMTGGSMTQASSWVTVILFMEIARRAMKTLSKQNLVVLLHAAQVMMAGQLLFPGGPMGRLVYAAYLSGSDAARDAGMVGSFPRWFVPPLGSPAITERNLLHVDWLVPVALIVFITMIGIAKKYTLGYFFFRLASDVEELPFPLATVSATGAMAMAESEERVSQEEAEKGLGKAGERKKSLRWRIFTLGASLGIAFGFFQVGVPAVTGLFLSKPFFLIPQPFVDTTVLTQSLLPATPTGVTFDLGIILLGFVLPFWAVLGTFVAIICTIIMNPILHSAGILHHWHPGMNTVNTTFANSIDFWLSFTVGTGIGLMAISVFSAVRDVRRKVGEVRARRNDEQRRESAWAPPRPGRGDYSLWAALLLYVLASGAVVAVCIMLLPRSPTLVAFLLFFAFLYTPLYSYINTRLMGIAGQSVPMPFVRESAYILSGVKGIGIWLAPIPIENYANQAQSFRVTELTGVRFWSLLKADLVAVPVMLLLSFAFWGFIWHSDAIPSDVFPAAQVNWDLRAKNNVLLFSSTFVAPGEENAQKSITDTELWKAVHPGTIASGFAASVTIFAVLSVFGLPIAFVYGLVRGFGRFPHVMILEIVGALLGRLYFQKKFGRANFMRAAPVLLAGYLTGVGLIGMATIALKLIKAGVSTAPF